MSWIAAAFASTFFAGITSILAKCGIKTVDSDVATALRTCVVLVFAWVMAALSGPLGAIASISARSWLFLVLSGLATGASWVCYFKALAIGDVNKVVPVDKSSAALATLLAIMLFGETDNLGVKLAGTAAVTLGTFMMIEKKRPATGEAAAGEAATGEAAAGRAAAGEAAGVEIAAGKLAAGEADRSRAVEKRGGTALAATVPGDRAWLPWAIGAAVFAALTSLLAKVGIEGVESNLATAIRTCVVLAMAWTIVAAKGKLGQARDVSGRELGFLAASGLATGASWLLYYYAISAGQVSVVVQIDKLSVVVSVLFARFAFGERLTRRSAAGLALIVLGAAAMAWRA